MRKLAKVALLSLTMAVIATASAAGGFYLGMRIGSTAIEGLAETNKMSEDFSDVSSSVDALAKDDPNIFRHQLAIRLREDLFDLGALSKSKSYFRCTEKERRSLAEAANYVATHPDPVLFGPEPFLTNGIKFCESRNGGQEVTVSYMTTGKHR